MCERSQLQEIAEAPTHKGASSETGPKRKFWDPTYAGEEKFRVVLIAGFETFNRQLYRMAAEKAVARCPGLEIWVFTDQDLQSQQPLVEQAVDEANVVFASLIFDFEQVNWLRERILRVPVRFVFESSLELMSSTKVGSFSMASQPGKKQGMPPAVKSLLSKFSSTREEDRLDGYTKFLKSGPALLKFIPGEKAKDLRRWLQTYSYWNAGGVDNVANMFCSLASEFGGLQPGSPAAEVIEAPQRGLVHPARPGYYFKTPREYLDWYRAKFPGRESWPVAGILLYRKHVISALPYIDELVTHMETKEILPLPLFITGVDGHIAVRDFLTSPHEQEQLRAGTIPVNPTLSPDAVNVDAVISTIGFPLVGGPAGSMEGARQAEIAKEILQAKNVPYFVAAPLLIQDVKSWFGQGIGGLQSVVLYSLPELDGAIDTIPLGGLCCGDKDGEIRLVEERLDRLSTRIKRWVSLRSTPKSERRVAVVLYGYPPGIGATGTAALLNVPTSLHKLLSKMKEEGYDVGELPEDPEELLQMVKVADDESDSGRGYANAQYAQRGGATVSTDQLETWLGSSDTQRVSKNWGGSLDRSGIRTVGSGERAQMLLGGVLFGKVWVAVQPPLGLPGDPMRLLFERDMTPHPQYSAFYKFLERKEEDNGFGANVVVHFGMHGTEEWLPGTSLGNTGECWPDILTGSLPNVYVYAANNPSESLLAKRRGYGTLISHNVPPYSRAGLYKELQTLRGLIADYFEGLSRESRGAAMKVLEEAGGIDGGEEAVERCAAYMVRENMMMEYCERLKAYLAELEQRLFSSGLHVLGDPPVEQAMEAYLRAYFEDGSWEVTSKERTWDRFQEAVRQGCSIRDLLLRNTEELEGVLKALNGEFVPPAPGGDLLRDGSGVLPTGRNIHALDPYRIPSKVAMARGKAAAELSISLHRKDNNDEFPETIAVNLWGLEAIKTRGESVGIVLGLVGAEPVVEATGRVVRFDLIPLEKLGRPRVDVLTSLSGIFRDSFSNVVELLDDLFERAAKADEPADMNFIRKHALELQAAGETVEASTARIFSNPPGEFGSLVNERVTDGNWEDEADLGETWAKRNAFSFGRSGRGVERRSTLNKLMSTTGQVVQCVDSVEYGLTDIQEYYANTGAMVRAMDDLQGGKGKVQASVVESYSKVPRPKRINEVLRLEYRSKLLNPKWANSMVDQGSGGAFEVSQRMTAMIGWGATTKFKEPWVFDQSAATYALDPVMAQKLRDSNPEAFKNIVGRLLEANNRGMWEAKPDVLQQLQEIYEDIDDAIELGTAAQRLSDITMQQKEKR
ncbi:hypothetical protein GUITHDRAFT_77048 [Guillardia theta CCMP2712]|uniref:magnesium chelatase n=1 Tax=Guillardia theta (strain CCMP2712) TaxID=905079 RepID=L1IRU8_GUITC|nr:hypothetical protein GUITHDRAFT_77048 [Guillardia theta CCMP2712]EKX38555.1 hypothetical protein GUITHDRAFT_77048 [Guillardia theta CCMP2712]|eukprot:XP_005825535.1 hypothetical protein GUITHDRAFT_77048 [Guillardia theta CCMP2712]